MPNKTILKALFHSSEVKAAFTLNCYTNNFSLPWHLHSFEKFFFPSLYFSRPTMSCWRISSFWIMYLISAPIEASDSNPCAWRKKKGNESFWISSLIRSAKNGSWFVTLRAFNDLCHIGSECVAHFDRLKNCVGFGMLYWRPHNVKFFLKLYEYVTSRDR